MTVSEQPNPERSHPVGLSTPSTSWGSRTGTVLKVEHSKTLPPGPPLRAREVFANRFTEAASTGDTRRALQVCRRPLPTGVHTGESTSNPGRAHARHHPSLRPRRALSGGQGVITVKNLIRKKGREGRGARQRERTRRARRWPPRCLGDGDRGRGPAGRDGSAWSAPPRGPGRRPLPLRALPEAALRCGAGGRRGRAAGLHGAATFSHSSLSRPCESTIRHGRGRKPPAHMPPARAERPAGLLQSVSDTVWSAPATTAPSIAGATDLLSALSTEG